MARPRTSIRSTSPSFFDSRRDDRLLCPALKDALDTCDPALAEITTRVLAARMAGENTTDPVVIARCIRQGREDHARAELGGAA